MCILIEKLNETVDTVQYAFAATVQEPDANCRNRMRTAGQNRGVLQIAKATGEVTLVQAMPEDEGNLRFACAAARIRKHWKAKEYPDKTLFACG